MMPWKCDGGLPAGRTRGASPRTRSSALPLACFPGQNRLLAAMPAEPYARLRPLFEWVCLPRGMVIYDEGGTVESLYFPVSGIVSIVCTTQSGESAEVAMVGNDGAIGIPLLLAGGDSTNSRAVVQCAGFAFRVAASGLRREFTQCEALLALLLAYTKEFVAHAMQNAACARHHSLEQRLCRCLLTGLHRMESNTLPITHEAIGASIGAHRAGVTLAAARLQRAGIIQCGRGKVAVLDRSGLESRACGCYATFTRDMSHLGVALQRQRRAAALNGLLGNPAEPKPALRLSAA